MAAFERVQGSAFILYLKHRAGKTTSVYSIGTRACTLQQNFAVKSEKDGKANDVYPFTISPPFGCKTCPVI